MNREEILKELRLALTNWENTYETAKAAAKTSRRYASTIIRINSCTYGFCHYFKLKAASKKLYSNLINELFKDYEYNEEHSQQNMLLVEYDYCSHDFFIANFAHWYYTYEFSAFNIDRLLPRIENLKRTIKRLENEY